MDRSTKVILYRSQILAKITLCTLHWISHEAFCYCMMASPDPARVAKSLVIRIGCHEACGFIVLFVSSSFQLVLQVIFGSCL